MASILGPDDSAIEQMRRHPGLVKAHPQSECEWSDCPALHLEEPMLEKPMQKPIPEKNPINYEMSGKLSPERAAEIFPELITNRPEPDPSFEERIKDATFRFEQERMQYRRPVRDNPQA